MKETLAYILVGSAFGEVVFRLADIDNAPEWKAWIVLIIFMVGLVLFLEYYKNQTKKEIIEDLDKKIEEKLEEMNE